MRELLAEQRASALSDSRAPTPHRRFIRFAGLVLVYNVAVILWGALVRATGSGAGCGGHWPLCNGDVLPNVSQTGTVIEFTHRVMSGVALILVVALFAWARSLYAAGHPARRWAAWSVVFILTEALLGASLVLLGHVARDESVGRVYSLASHLVNTFLLLASLAVAAWFAAPEAQLRMPRPSLSTWGTLVGLAIVAVAGAIAALGDTLFPSHTLAEGIRNDFSSTASFLLRLRIIHPLLAIMMGGWIALIAIPAYRAPRTIRMRALSGWLLVLFVVQIVAGAANILFQAPVPLQLLHLLMADAIWILLVLFSAEVLAAPAAVRK